MLCWPLGNLRQGDLVFGFGFVTRSFVCVSVRAAGKEGGGSGGTAEARVPGRARRRRRAAHRLEGLGIIPSSPYHSLHRAFVRFVWNLSECLLSHSLTC